MTIVEALNNIAAKIDGDSQDWLIITNAADQLSAASALKETIAKQASELDDLREIRAALKLLGREMALEVKA